MKEDKFIIREALLAFYNTADDEDLKYYNSKFKNIDSLKDYKSKILEIIFSLDNDNEKD